MRYKLNKPEPVLNEFSGLSDGITNHPLLKRLSECERRAVLRLAVERSVSPQLPSRYNSQVLRETGVLQTGQKVGDVMKQLLPTIRTISELIDAKGLNRRSPATTTNWTRTDGIPSRKHGHRD